MTDLVSSTVQFHIDNLKDELTELYREERFTFSQLYDALDREGLAFYLEDWLYDELQVDD